MIISKEYAQQIVDDVKANIQRDINIMDNSGYIIASTNPVRLGQLHQGALQIIRENRKDLTVYENDASRGVQSGINLPILMNGATVGVIGITGPPEEVSVFGGIIKKMAELMLENAQKEEQYSLLEKTRRLFIENWLFSEDPDWAELEVRGKLLNLDISLPYTVAILRFSPSPSQKSGQQQPDTEKLHGKLLSRMIDTHIKDNPNHFYAEIKDYIIVFFCNIDLKSAFSKINRIKQDIESYYEIQLSCGISNKTKTSADIRRCYLEAKAASQVAAHDEKRRVIFYNEASLEFIVQSIPGDILRDLRKLVFSDCSDVEIQEFSKTIQLYFLHEGNFKECAETLFIHRNTFGYRVDQIKKKTGYDLKKPKDSILLYLAST